VNGDIPLSLPEDFASGTAVTVFRVVAPPGDVEIAALGLDSRSQDPSAIGAYDRVAVLRISS
jgi:hypothetical protein